MDKKFISIVCIVVVVIGIAVYSAQWEGPVVTSSASPKAPETESWEVYSNEDDSAQIADGKYFVDFDTDSSMFHVNEAMDGKGILTVKDGKMMLHISLPSQSIQNLYLGLAEDAKKDGAVLLNPTWDSVVYEDGTTEDVHGFDIEVPYLDEEFDLALIGTKGKWYDHKVSVSNPMEYDISKDKSAVGTGEGVEESVDAEGSASPLPEGADTKGSASPESGKYEKPDTKGSASPESGKHEKPDTEGSASPESGKHEKPDTEGSASPTSKEEHKYIVELSGGSGRASVTSPCTVKVSDGKTLAVIEWSSDKYDYMIVDGEKYLPVNTSGNSLFEIPVPMFNEPFLVIADTVAMGNPHEIEYTLLLKKE